MFYFADDAKIYIAITKLAEQEELQKDLYKLKKWSNGGDLESNLTKCHQLTLSSRTKSSNRTYSLDGTTPLTRVNSEKDLGIIIDTKLSFHEHISMKTKTANGILAIIKKCFLNINAKGWAERVRRIGPNADDRIARSKKSDYFNKAISQKE